MQQQMPSFVLGAPIATAGAGRRKQLQSQRDAELSAPRGLEPDPLPSPGISAPMFAPRATGGSGASRERMHNSLMDLKYSAPGMYSNSSDAFIAAPPSIARSRSTSAPMMPGYPSVAGASTGMPMVPSMRRQIREAGDMAGEATRISNLAPIMPREAESPRTNQVQLTFQHAKAMWDNVMKEGVNQEGYNPVPIFQKMLAKYGVDAVNAKGLAGAFQQNAADPQVAMKYLNPAQRQQVTGAQDQVAEAQKLNPFTPGNTFPGYSPLMQDKSGSTVAPSYIPEGPSYSPAEAQNMNAARAGKATSLATQASMMLPTVAGVTSAPTEAISPARQIQLDQAQQRIDNSRAAIEQRAKGPATRPAAPSKPKEPSSADVSAVARDLLNDPDHGAKPLAERMRLARGMLREQMNESGSQAAAPSTQPTGRGGKPVPRATAMEYVQRNGGDVNKAREALMQDGFDADSYAD